MNDDCGYKNRKIFVIDTSVLLYDSKCFKEFSGNNVFIPMTVLEEIDKFKNREGILGENAREVNRFLDDLRKDKINNSKSLNEGIYIPEHDILVTVESRTSFENINLDKNDNDNKIIACANYLKECYSYDSIVVITKDINLRVKCDALNIRADDYYADYAFIRKGDKEELFQGSKEVTVQNQEVADMYNSGFIRIDRLSLDEEIMENEFLVLKDYENNSVLGIKKEEKLVLVNTKETHGLDIKAKNKDQHFALNLLNDDTIPLVTLTGVPGSGKTYLTLMSALKQIEKQKKQRIIFTRPIQTVGKDIGFLPGTLNEKMAPWLAPIVDNFRNQFGDLAYFELMMDKGIIDVAPLSYIRGRSFNDAIIIVDEAQNATVHELKTVITRTGKNSKIVLLGDIEQIDLPYINKFSNGLTIVIEKLKETKLTGHVNFTKGYRSELANLVAEKLN